MQRAENFEIPPDAQSPPGAVAEASDEAIAGAMKGDLTEDQQKLLKNLDKESHTRKLASSFAGKIFYLLCLTVSLYHFITAFVGTPVVLEHRSLHVGMMLVLGFIMYPFGKGSSYKAVSWCDWLCIAGAVAIPIYIWTNYLGVVERAGNPNVVDLIAATLLVVLVLRVRGARPDGLSLF